MHIMFTKERTVTT